MAEHRKGRGRLSGIDLLPPEASEIIVWANQQLMERKRTQLDIYAEFKTKLIGLQGGLGRGFDIPAFSSFSRFSLQKAEDQRDLAMQREIASALAAHFDDKGNEDVVTMAVETLKVALLETLRRLRQKGASSKEMMEMSRALNSLVATSKLSAGRRQEIQKAMDEAGEEAIDKAAVVAKEAGVSAESIAQMRREFLGVRPKLKAGAA